MLFALLLASACRSGRSTWERVQAEGLLRVGLDPTYPPFESTDGVAYQGIDVELAQAVAEELGVTVSFSQFGYDGLYDALGTGQVDVLISALVADPSRTNDFAFSEGYVNSGLVLASLGDTGYRDFTELTGRVLAIELGSLGHVEATTWQRQAPGMSISTQQSADEALTSVVVGQADAALVDHISARLFVGQQNGTPLALEPVSYDPYVMVVRREDGQLLAQLDRALAEVRESGQLDAILASWFQE